MSYLALGEYGLIGNQASALLVSRFGSIDWACLPYLDSPSHFSAILDENMGGRFQIMPQGEFVSEQRYLQRTNVLETKFETPTGRAVLLDWMPIEGKESPEPIVYRRIEVIDGRVPWTLTCTPRFKYGSEPGQAERSKGGILFRGSHPEDLGLLLAQIPIQISADGNSAVSKFELEVGKRVQFTWIWGRHQSTSDFPGPEKTVEYWRSWAHGCGGQGPSQCLFAGPWHDVVTRSGLALKLLIAYYSGAIAEAPTTSLPIMLGGSRNWDYRYSWLRDSALTIQALAALGHTEESDVFFGWLADIVTRDGAEGLQPVYTLDGGKFLPEREVPALSGYEGSRPVRVGNQSARQFQLDVYGHVMLAVAQNYQLTGKLPEGLWNKLVDVCDYVCQAWRRPDRGPWEVRTRPEHFVASKVLCWAALDRGCWLAEALKVKLPQRWLDERDILHRLICEQGYDTRSGSFVRAFGDHELDASTLLIPLLGFLPFDDPRVQGTMDAIQRELSDGVLVHRYKTDQSLPESDGAHLLSSFWFVSCLALSGRVDEASDRLAELCSYATTLGLFGEQVSPATGEPTGNYPSASAHLAMINASLYVGMARGRKSSLSTLMGLRSDIKSFSKVGAKRYA